jgi:hypothetical protein
MGVVNTTYTFTSTDTITSAKMNNIIDDTTFTSDAIQGTTLQVVSPGKLAVSAGGITSNELASNSVVTAKILDSNVTTAKIADSNVTTAKIADANVTPVKLSQPFTSGTAQNSTSGTSIDFTGIPSWVKRITVMFNGVSTNGTSPLSVQMGSGSIETSGYLGSASVLATGAATTQLSGGFDFAGQVTQGSAYTRNGLLIISLLGSNVWTASGSVGLSDQARLYFLAGSKSFSGVVDRVRITTVNGTDTFDAGSVNIMYE